MLVVVALLAATLTAGCDGSEPSTGREPKPTATATASSTASSPRSSDSAAPTGGPTLDPAHAVDSPGPRTGVVGYPDIVVTSSKSIDAETIAAIQHLDHVQDVLPIALAQVIVQNRALQVAAVDPATYRNYTRLEVAESQDIWDRVARGELAIKKSLVARLPVDDNDFVGLGSTAEAPEVHIGAYAAQAPLIDAVVNDTWIPDLGMTPDNALLIRTGGTAPVTLRKAIEGVLAGKASVQMTDAVARYGIDPNVVQTAVVVGTIADAVGVYRYSVLAGGRIAPDPAWVAEHITTQTVPILGSVTCNKAIFPQLIAALNAVRDQGLADKIHPGEYAGCYNARFIAGSTKLSNHAFGLALDLNVPGNQRGTVGQMDRQVVAIFKSWGFTWGGDWGYTDPMHFEMNRLVEPR
ncbi:hypothetical protein GCM10023349_22570 [Nocardioides conyzicola]|uniref:Peptidase M15C domain-containing protein n=2 Tax=Nocardioides conyzicola TaxID=1651781 RepID=A0ABP8XC51_9ACTN